VIYLKPIVSMFVLKAFQGSCLKTLVYMKPRRKLFSLLAFAGSSLIAASSAFAQTSYWWDSNSTTAGFGNTTGIWGTNTFWSTSSDGSGATANTTITGADTVNFGTATLNYASGTVGVAAGGVTVGGIVMGAGQTQSISLGTSGNAITIYGGGITKNTGSAQLSMIGPVILGAAQTWTNNSSTNLSTPDGTTNFINNGGFNLTVDGTGTTVFGILNPGTQSISGSGALIKNGTGTLQIGGNNTAFSGNITVNNGTLYYGDNVGALGTGNINITNGIIEGRWDSPLSRNQGSGAGQIQITGGVSGFSNGRNVIYAMGASATWGSATFNPTEFVLQGSGTGSIQFSTAIDLNGADRTIRSNNANTAGIGTFTGVISGTGAGIIKEGVGHQLFTNTANTYSGATTINAGILTARVLANGGSNSSIGISGNAASNLLIGNGATFRYDGSGHSTNRSFTINGTAAGHGASLDASGTGAANFTNTASPAYGTVDQTRTLTLTGTSTGTNTLAANIANNGTGAVSVNKTGAGLWILSGTNSYAGGTTLSAGTLSVGAAANLGDTSSNLVFNGGTLQITGTSLTNFASLGRANPISLTSGQTVALDINNAANVFTVDQTLNQGTGGLTKAGAGTLVLNSAHTYTGVTTISAGTLQLGSATATGSLSTSGIGLNIASGATFAVNRSDTVTQGTDFNALILGSGTLSNVGAGSLVLNTPTFHTGNTTATAGNITLSHQRAIKFSALNTTGAGSVTLSGTGSTTPIIGGLANSGTTRNLASVIDSSYASVTNLTLNPQSGSTFSYGGVIADGATGMTLTKTGAGTQTLTGANTYTGATTVNGGTLNLGGATATGSLASTVLSLGGGTFSYTRTGTNTQAFTTTNVTTGANSVTASLATQTINMGSLAGRVVGSTLDVSATGTITTTTANDATGILGGWATITNNNWAVSSGSGLDITGLAAFYTTSTGGTTAANYAAKNIDIDSSPTIVGNINANTIRFNSNSRVLTLPAGDNIFGAGGILVASGVTGSQITGGNLLGSSGGDLIVHGHGDLTIGSLIKNNGTATALTKSGGGTLTLSGTNTFSGGVFMNAGTLQIASAANLGDSANVVTFAGSSTLLFSSGTTLTQGFAINEGVTGTLRAGNQTVTVNGPLAGSGTLFVYGTSTSGINLTFASTNNTFSGDIQMRGDSASYPVSLTMNSLEDTPGSLIRFGQNGQTPAFTYGAGAVAPLVLNHRRLEHNAGSEYGASFNNNATLTSSIVTVNTDLILSGTVGNKPFTLGGSNTGDNAFAGAITNGAGGYVTRLTKAGAGRWILSNINNSYTSTTTVSAGTLSINSIKNVGAGASAVGAPTSVANGTIAIGSGGTAGTLEYTGSGHTTDRVLNLAGTTGGVTLDQSGTGLLHFTSNFTATGAGSKTLTLRGSTAGTGQISGAIVNNSGSNTTSLTKSGSGIWILSGANTYTGTTSLGTNGGILQFGKANSLYNGITGSWTAANIRVANGGTLAFNVGGTGEFSSSDVGTLFTNLANSTNATTNGMAAGSRFGFDTTNANGGSFEITQAVANSGGTAGGARGLTKLGTGTLVLSNTNTYTGSTTVSAGMLAITGSGSINDSSGITVASGAHFKYNSSTALTTSLTLNAGSTLSGSGTIARDLGLNSTDQILAPGNSPGIQTLAATQNWSSFTYEWETNNFTGTTAGTDFDQIAITGDLNLTGTTASSYTLDILSLTSSNAAGGVPSFEEINRTWNIITTTGSITGFNASYWTLNTAGFTSSAAWQGTWSLGLNGTSDTLVLNYSAYVIPEPKAALLGGIGLLLILRLRRRG